MGQKWLRFFFTKILNADENVYKNLLKFLSPQRREKCLSFRMKSDSFDVLFRFVFKLCSKKRMTEKPIFVPENTESRILKTVDFGLIYLTAENT